MNRVTTVDLKTPYLMLIGAEDDPTYAKTGLGIVQWRPQLVAGQMRFPGCTVDLGVPEMSIAEAVTAGVGSLVIGVAPVGGVIPESWWGAIREAVDAGLDVVCGLHAKLNERPELVAAAKASGARLIDVRVPPRGLPVGNGRKRTGRRLLTVGTDCAVGKKYTALAIDQALREAGMDSSFRATGQTGIMIAGEGMPIDAVVADFISGAAEVLTPDNDPDHWDVVEGQGSLFHPGYSGVSLGLLHGTQPDAFVVCHDAVRTHISDFEHFALPSIADCIELHVAAGRRTNPGIRCVGISLNTSGLPAVDRVGYKQELAAAHGVPCVDPLVDGCSSIVDYLRLQQWD